MLSELEEKEGNVARKVKEWMEQLGGNDEKLKRKIQIVPQLFISR